MLLRKKLLCGVASAAMVLGSITAASAAPETTGWNGFYFGTHMGYGNARFKGQESIGATPIQTHTHDANGFLFGAHAGYNWELMMSNLVAGIEGDISVMPTHGMETDNHSTQFITGHLSGIGSLRARLGWTFNNALFFATGGLAVASYNAVGGHTTHANDHSKVKAGGVLGGGVEYMISPNMSLRAEALYYLFDGRQNPNGSMSGNSGLDDTWLFRVGASWHLGDTPFTESEASNRNFQGFYIGGHVGYGSAEYSGQYTDNAADPSVTLQANGFLSGVHAGYNWEFMSNVLFGIEADISVMPWTGTETAPDNSTEVVSGHLSGIASLRGRIGFVMNRALFYATGGIAFASTNAIGGYTTQFNDRTKIAAGGVVGGGVELLTGENMSIRAEGLYYMFNQNKQGASWASGQAGINDAWVARLGASWYFNGANNSADEPPANFAGFYLGGHAGYGSAEYSGIDSTNSDFASFNAKGFLVGAHMGYNWMTVHNILAGIEGDISLAPWHGGEDPTDDSEFVTGHLNGIASMRARLGLQLDRALLFATGGIAFAASNAVGGSSVQYNGKTEIEVGPVAGLGIEYMADENLSLRFEGLHYWFDQDSVHHGGSGSGIAGIQNTWLFRVGASWHFN